MTKEKRIAVVPPNDPDLDDDMDYDLDRKTKAVILLVVAVLWMLVALMASTDSWGAAGDVKVKATWEMPTDWTPKADDYFHFRVDITGPDAVPARITKRRDQVAGELRTAEVTFTDMAAYPPESMLWGAVKTCNATLPSSERCSAYTSVTMALGEVGGGGGTVILIVPVGIEVEIRRSE